MIVRHPAPEGVAIRDSGYRFGDWVFSNAVDVRIKGHDAGFLGTADALTFDARLDQARRADPPGE